MIKKFSSRETTIHISACFLKNELVAGLEINMPARDMRRKTEERAFKGSWKRNDIRLGIEWMKLYSNTYYLYQNWSQKISQRSTK